MAETLKPFPSLTCRHLKLTSSQHAQLKRLQQLAEKNSKRSPRSLADFQRQYAQNQEQHHGTTPN